MMDVEVREYVGQCASGKWLATARAMSSLHRMVAITEPPGPVYVSTRIFNTRRGIAYQDKLLCVIRPKVGTKSGTGPSGSQSVERVN